jgi:hypothetical protein
VTKSFSYKLPESTSAFTHPPTGLQILAFTIVVVVVSTYNHSTLEHLGKPLLDTDSTNSRLGTVAISTSITTHIDQLLLV